MRSDSLHILTQIVTYLSAYALDEMNDCNSVYDFLINKDVLHYCISYDSRQSQSLVAHIGNLVVADGFRRQGVGLGLMTEACQTAKSWGYPAVYCGL